jgi:hypothetical protein
METRDSHGPFEVASDAMQQAFDKLKSPHDGDGAIPEVVSYGDQAIPFLRTLLFDREPSGLYQARVRAVDALTQLNAYGVLVDFLNTPREVSDPVERLGEDAAINAAARALAYRGDPRVFELLLRLARRPCLTGVIFALGTYRDAKSIPLLVEALAEDASRLTAETALKRIGAAARSALAETVGTGQSSEQDSESRLRQRRSALQLLADKGVSQKMWQTLRPLMYDADVRIAVTASEICLANGSAADKRDSVSRLIRLSAHADWSMRDEIERYLVAYLYVARDALPKPSQLERLMMQDGAIKDFVERILRRLHANDEGSVTSGRA